MKGLMADYVTLNRIISFPAGQASPEAQVLCQVEAARRIRSLKRALWFHCRNLTEVKNASDKKVGLSKNGQGCPKGGNDFAREVNVEVGKMLLPLLRTLRIFIT
jgi:hypothetical protein